MFIEGAPVLHVVDDAKQFNAAQFSQPPITNSLWETTLTLWATVNCGLLYT